MTDDAQAANARIGKPEIAILERLREKSREELLFLIEQLLERKPDIKPLIELLTALFNIWNFGQDYGGINTDVADTIALNVTKAERKMVEDWLRQQIQTGQSNWRSQGLRDFLERLKEEPGETET